MKSKSLIVTIVIVALASAVVISKRELKAHQPISATAASQPAPPKQLWHCGMHPQVIWDHPGKCPICRMDLTPFNPQASTDAEGAKRSAGPTVTIDPVIVQNMGVRIAKVTRGQLEVTIRTIGMLQVPQPELHDVSLRVGGFVEKIYADTDGMHVHQGDVLFDLYSPDLQAAATELIAAVGARKALGATAGDASKQEADDLVASARQRLSLWDIADIDIDAIAAADHAPKTVPIRSSASGAIVDKVIVQGSAVTAGMKVMQIEGHSKLWLDAEVYEGQLQLVSLGQDVEATFESLPGVTFKGQVAFIYPHVGHVIRTETVRTTLDNSELKLRPGMYATVKLIARPVPDAILVPREAVIDTGTRKIAFVAESQGHFTPRDVKTGLAGDNDQLQILDGLSPGESVVTSGQFLMDVESRTTEAIEKLREAPGPELMH